MARLPNRRIELVQYEEGKWAIVMDGRGCVGLPTDDDKRVRRLLTESRIAWTDDADNLSLTLVEPNFIDIAKARQICNEIFMSKIPKGPLG